MSRTPEHGWGLPRFKQSLSVPIFPTNPGKSKAARVQLSNFPEEFQRNKTRVTVIFTPNGIPTSGGLYVRPTRYLENVGQGRVPYQDDEQQLVAFGKVVTTAADNYPQVYSVEISGFAELWFENTMDVDLLTVSVQIEVIASPTNNVGA